MGEEVALTAPDGMNVRDSRQGSRTPLLEDSVEDRGREWSVMEQKDGWEKTVYTVIRVDYVRASMLASPGPHTNSEANKICRELQDVVDILEE